MGLVVAFVGGFVFLVATMDRPGGDGWGGDDGAVVEPGPRWSSPSTPAGPSTAG